MARITAQEHSTRGALEETEVVALYVNGVKIREYIVPASFNANVVFSYHEREVVVE